MAWHRSHRLQRSFESHCWTQRWPLRALLLAGLLARAQEDDDGLVVYGWDSDALEEQDEWGLPAFRERHIKVHHLSPSFGRNAGGLLVNATGKGASSSSRRQP